MAVKEITKIIGGGNYPAKQYTTNSLVDKHGTLDLPDSPGFNAREMQEKFEEIATDLLIPVINKMIDQLQSADGASSIGSSGGRSMQETATSISTSVSSLSTKVTAMETGKGDMFKSQYDPTGEVLAKGGLIAYMDSLVNVAY